MSGQATGAWPDLYDAFFEFGEEAFFFQAAEGGVGSGAGAEGAVGGEGGGVGVDGRFGGDEVVRG